MRDAQPHFPRGRIVRERYIVEALLGKGGSGAVYRVRDRHVRGNVFALKEVLNPNPYERESVVAEWEILKRLDHQALPRVYRIFTDRSSGYVYLLMDYVEGSDLELLRLQEPLQRLAVAHLLQIMAPIVEALCYLHAQQPPVLHRDIKPANILVPHNNEQGAVLIDFGIAKAYQAGATTTAIRHCSPGYAAPEQYMHGTNTRTDIYGLAATLYTLLTGVAPTDALYRITTLSSKGHDPLPAPHLLLPTLSNQLSCVLLRALALSDSERFESVEAFWQAFYAAASEENMLQVSSAGASSPVLLELEKERYIERPESQQQAEQLSCAEQIARQSEGRLVLILPVLMVITLLAGILFSLALPHSSLLVYQRSSSTQRLLTAIRQGEPHRAATPTVAGTAKSAPQALPVRLATRYDGMISAFSVSANGSTALTLQQIQQDGQTIHGYLSSGSASMSVFRGTIFSDKSLQFLVSSDKGEPPILFQGVLHADGSLSGTYCSVVRNACRYPYGKWVAYRALNSSA